MSEGVRRHNDVDPFVVNQGPPLLRAGEGVESEIDGQTRSRQEERRLQARPEGGPQDADVVQVDESRNRGVGRGDYRQQEVSMMQSPVEKVEGLGYPLVVQVVTNLVEDERRGEHNEEPRNESQIERLTRHLYDRREPRRRILAYSRARQPAAGGASANGF